MGSILGNRVLRVEDPRMLTVGGTYVEDVELADALALTYVRSPVAHAMIGAIEFADALALPGVVAIFTGADVAAGIGRADHVNPLFHDAMRRPFVASERCPLRRSTGGRNRVGDSSDRNGCHRPRRRRLRPAARDRRPRGVATRRRAAPPGRGHECRAPGVDPARRLHRLRGDRRGQDREPAGDGGTHRASLRCRLLDRRRTSRALRRLSGPAPDPRLARRRVRPREVAGARHHARCRRRLRRQVADLSRGVGARLLRARRRPAGALDRDPLREHDGDAARAQPGAARRAWAAPATAT